MTRQFLKRTGILLSALFLISTLSFSQIDNFDFLRSTTADATKYLRAYMTPWTDAFGAGLNGGWYNTAKPHKLGGFDITSSFNVGIVPTSAGTFELSSLGLSSSWVQAGTTTPVTGITPSVSGPADDDVAVDYVVNGNRIASFSTPGGLDWRYIPVPTLQVGLGLPLGTEIKGRYLPKLRYDGGDISLWGVGLLHSLTQYMPGDKLLPFDVSLFGGYTKLTGNVPLSLLPENGITQAYSPVVSFSGQKLNASVSGLNLSAIASLNLPVITFYGGLGYSKTKTEMELDGNFPTPVLVAGQPVYNNTGIKTNKDFQNIEIENFSGVRANIGLRIKLAVITIHADYTKAQYNVISFGLGLSFR